MMDLKQSKVSEGGIALKGMLRNKANFQILSYFTTPYNKMNRQQPNSTGTQPITSQHTKSSKTNTFRSQNIFKTINAIVFFILLFCTKGFLHFREVCQQQGLYVLSLASISWSILGFFAIFVFKSCWCYLMKEWAQRTLDTKFQGEERIQKTKELLISGFSSLFFLLSSVSSYLLFREEYWFPKMAGGCGYCSQIYKEYPSWPMQSFSQLQKYMMFQLGVQCYSLFQLLTSGSSNRKYYECVLHDAVAISLILFTTLSNQVAVGTMAVILHDASDILISLTKFYGLTNGRKKWISRLGYVGMMMGWVWMRIVVYPFCLLAQVYANQPASSDLWSMIWFEYWWLMTIAFILQGMHLFWTYLMVKVGVREAGSKQIQRGNNVQDGSIRE